MTGNWHKAVLWFVGAVALVGIANYAPGAATMVVLILIVLVLFAHWNDTYAPFLFQGTKLGSITGSGAGSSKVVVGGGPAPTLK